ncbi:MAG: inositol monophosphatase family protein [Porticoccaceae bacterium]|nr:inositol monophosphatase family protein [Porticoccaceae bacterium]MEA3299904.1 inositol monophosphatase family protein [Pseudomonadota bacterium]HLS97813.1 inositol monophosphatase family protein [Porticoccaceae bacterium]
MEPMVNIALRAARSAGDKIVRAAERMDLVKVDEKGRNDFVTDVDRASEQEIISHLQKAYPDHRILGEESGYIGNPDSDYLWVIDPLDGTTNFLRGIPHYAVSIGCLYKGKPEHAVVFDPVKQEEFTASRGRGAVLNGRRIRVTGRTAMEGALFATGVPFSLPSSAHMEPYLESFKALAEQSSGIRRLGVASLDLAYLAAGRFDAFWEMHLKPWDIAAGVLLVKEAGGMISDFQGDNGYMESGHVVAATPRLFKPTLQVVQKHLGYLR